VLKDVRTLRPLVGWRWATLLADHLRAHADSLKNDYLNSA